MAICTIPAIAYRGLEAYLRPMMRSGYKLVALKHNLVGAMHRSFLFSARMTCSRPSSSTTIDSQEQRFYVQEITLDPNKDGLSMQPDMEASKAETFDKAAWLANRQFEVLKPEMYYESLQVDTRDSKGLELAQDIACVLKIYETRKKVSERTPTTLSPDDMKTLVAILREESDASVMRYLRILFGKEFGRVKREYLHLVRLQEMEKRRALYSNNPYRYSPWDEEGNPVYSNWRNTMFTHISNPSRRKGAAVSRLRKEALFGQSFIVDFSWDPYMMRQERIIIAKRIEKLYQSNRRARSGPFNLVFANLSPQSTISSILPLHLQSLKRKDHMVNITNKHYLHLGIPKEKLIYLTPDCDDVMEEYDHDAVYVMAALCDVFCPSKMTLQRAIDEGIMMAKFPLEKYLTHVMNGTLCTDEVFGILLELKAGRSWPEALYRRIPEYKLHPHSIERLKEQCYQLRHSSYSDTNIL